jgi:hypothetical protein
MTGTVNPNVITFDAPTQFAEDNSSIPAGTILRYEYGFSQSPTGPFTTRVLTDTDFTPNPQGKQTHNLDLAGFAFGQWYGAGRAVSKDGPTSAFSNVVPFEVQAKTPKPPTGFSIA